MKTGHLVDWDFEALALFERELDGEVGVGSGMHDEVIGWDDEMPVDDDHVMTDGHASLPRNARASYGTAVGVPDVRLSGDVNGTETSAVGGRVAPGSGVGNTGGWHAVSRFGSLSCAILPSTAAGNKDSADGSESGVVSEPDGDFHLMYGRRFLCEAGEEVISERVSEGNYDQLVIYLRGRLDQ